MALPPYMLGPNPWAAMMVQQQAQAQQFAQAQAHAHAQAQVWVYLFLQSWFTLKFFNFVILTYWVSFVCRPKLYMLSKSQQPRSLK